MRSKAVLGLLVFLVLPTCFVAADRPIDTAHSKISIHVGKSGLFSAAGHEHEVTAPIVEGAIDESGVGHVWFRVEAAKLTVLPEKDQSAVQTDMQNKVLESARFPEIRFESTSIQKRDTASWAVTGKLALHGQSNPVTTEVRLEGHQYVGHAAIKQSEFGIKPVSAAGGAVKVKDELKIDFVIVPQ